MSRYLVFSYEMYYPIGGMNDCAFKTNDLRQAELVAYGLAATWQYVHIYDTKTDTVTPVSVE